MLFVVLSMLIFSVQVISPYQVFGSQSSLKDRNSARLTFGKESYVIEEIHNSEKETTIKLSAENDMEGKAKQSTIEVNYETGDFRITDETGKVEKYNVSEFIVEEEEKINPPDETEEEIIQKLRESGINVEDIAPNQEMQSLTDDKISILSAQYIQDRYFLVNGTINWQFVRSYQCNTCNTFSNVYQANHVEYLTTPKKLEFDAETTVAVILGAFIAIVGSGLTIAGLTAIIQGLSVPIAANAITKPFKPTVKVKRYNYLRRVNVGGNGNAVGTKSYTDYTEAAYNGEIVEEQYRTGKYNNWYNDIPSWQLADVAYEMHRYIKGYRTSAPRKCDFYWGGC